jgi:methionine salvage enolase-phosphatase E1
MQHLTKIFFVMFALILLSGSSFAQEEGHYYTVTTWKFMVPADGSNAELNELMKEWFDKVVSKNDKILSEKVLVHRSGSDMRDWVFISEYATWNDMDAANEVQNKLVDEGWPNEDDRTKFFDTFWKYVITHSDEILQEKPELAK